MRAVINWLSQTPCNLRGGNAVGPTRRNSFSLVSLMITYGGRATNCNLIRKGKA